MGFCWIADVDFCFLREVHGRDSSYGEIVDRFPIVWLHLMEDIAPSSFESYQLQADSLKLLKPSNYPGENITSLVQDWFRISDPLSLAGHYLPNYTTYLVTAALSAGGNTNHPDIGYFRQEVNTIRRTLNKVLLMLPSQTPVQQQRTLT